MPEGGGLYVMAREDAGDVAGMMEMGKEGRSKRVPPHWNTYFAVTNVDEMAQKVIPSGGTLLQPPIDVGDAGRMCAAADPSGAMFCLWQANKHIGAGVEGEPGAPTWAELETNDVGACRDFYTKLFGWNVQTMQTDDAPYYVFRVGEERACGMMAMSKDTPKGTLPHWTVYFLARDCDAAFQKARSMNARPVVPPTDIPNVGRFSMMFDPQGAFFAVLQPKPM